MQAEILTIGSELLNGATLNTNASHLARSLTGLGIVITRQVSVPDEPPLIVGAIREALNRSELLIISGGLGPTDDDVTMAAIAEAVNLPLKQQADVSVSIRQFYSAHKRRVHASALRQALLPEGGLALRNLLGTAPGLWLSLRTCIVVALPGVPAELSSILEQSVLPRLKRLRTLRPPASTTLRTIGIVELDIQRHLKRLALDPDIQIGLYPHLRTVDIRISFSRTRAKALIKKIEARLRRALGNLVYASGNTTLDEVVIALLKKRRLSLVVAESCTGGLFAHRLTNVPGSSKNFLGGAVAYHNKLKQGWLGVPAQAIAKHGAVSQHVAGSMAQGAREKTGADLGIGITGIAGPTGGSRQKPVGLVYLALADKKKIRIQKCRFLGPRTAVKFQAAQAAIDMLRLYLLKQIP